jgi:hypothetical protein
MGYKFVGIPQSVAEYGERFLLDSIPFELGPAVKPRDDRVQTGSRIVTQCGVEKLRDYSVKELSQEVSRTSW